MNGDVSMNFNDCKHITYDEIKRFLVPLEEPFTEEDLIFNEYVENCLDDCDVCAKRFNTYMFLSPEIDEETPDVDPVLLFKKYLQWKFGEIKEFFLGGFSNAIQPRRSLLAATRGATYSNGSSYSSVGQSNEIIKINDVNRIIDENGIANFDQINSFSEIEIIKKSAVLLNMPRDLDGRFQYALYLWRISDGEIFSYPVGMDRVVFYVQTDILDEGSYLAVVVRVTSHDG